MGYDVRIAVDHLTSTFVGYKPTGFELLAAGIERQGVRERRAVLSSRPSR